LEAGLKLSLPKPTSFFRSATNSKGKKVTLQLSDYGIYYQRNPDDEIQPDAEPDAEPEANR